MHQVRSLLRDTFITWVDSQRNKETLNKKNTTFASGKEREWGCVINMITLAWMARKGFCVSY